VADDLVTLAELVAAAGGGIIPFNLGVLWTTIAAEIKSLTGLSHASLPASGHLLDPTIWAGLPFCEGEALHFKPAAVPAAANA
jgi:NADH-quinone oxidoreductase subunit G